MFGSVLLKLVALAVCLCCACAISPGFKIRLSNKGLQYVNDVAHKILAQELKTLKIPDQNGRDSGLEWTVTNIQNRGCQIPTSSMVLSPGNNGVTWGMNQLGIDAHADWRVKYKKGWIHLSTHGSLDLEVRGVKVTGTVKLAQAGGRPNVAVKSCSAVVGSVNAKFHGDISFIINLFSSIINKKMKSLMQDEICKVVTKTINVEGNQKLSEMKVNVMVDDRFELNYSLVKPPAVRPQDIQTEHKGEVFWKGEREEAPFSPKLIPELKEESRMMYLWVTDYIANSFAFTAQKHDFLHYNLSSKDLPAGNKSYLNTTCSIFCIGRVIPQIGEKYPNAMVEVGITSLKAPKLSITPDNMHTTSMGNLDLYARTADKKLHYMITLKVEMALTVKGYVANERLSGEITDNSFHFEVVRSKIGRVQPKFLNLIMKGMINLGVIPKVNDVLKKGMVIPVTGAVSFQNSKLTLLHGSVLIATDIAFRDVKKDLTFVSEQLV